MLSDGDGCLNQPALTKKKKKMGKRKGFPTSYSNVPPRPHTGPALLPGVID